MLQLNQLNFLYSLISFTLDQNLRNKTEIFAQTPQLYVGDREKVERIFPPRMMENAAVKWGGLLEQIDIWKCYYDGIQQETE